MKFGLRQYDTALSFDLRSDGVDGSVCTILKKAKNNSRSFPLGLNLTGNGLLDRALDRDADCCRATATERGKKDFLSTGHVYSTHPARVATDFPDLLDVIREKVEPEREKQTRECRKTFWWHYGEKNTCTLSCHRSRYALMKDRNYGLPVLYNDFHNSQCDTAEILRMRKVQRLIDYAVLEQYQWNDINLENGFHVLHDLPSNDNIRNTISESARIEILRHLAQLNRQHWQKE